MPTEKKVAAVAELQDRLARATIAIGTGYVGLRVSEMAELRRALRGAGAELRVVKNTLLRRAAEAAGRPQILQLVEGPTAIAFSYDEDIVAPARALTQFLRTSRLPVTVRGALLDGEVLDGAGVEELASTPPREVLLGRIAGGLLAPAAHFVGLASGALRELAGLVEARAAQLEGQS